MVYRRGIWRGEAHIERGMAADGRENGKRAGKRRSPCQDPRELVLATPPTAKETGQAHTPTCFARGPLATFVVHVVRCDQPSKLLDETAVGRPSRTDCTCICTRPPYSSTP